MLKFLLILILFLYVFYKVGGFIMRAMYFGAGRQYQQRPPFNRGNTTDVRHEEIKVDYIPKDDVKKRKSSPPTKSGEYVDYEEIK